jgi:hypothetical protein
MLGLEIDQALPDGWTAKWLFEPTGASLELVKLTIDRSSGGGYLTTTAVRELRPAAAQRSAERLVRGIRAVLALKDDLEGGNRWTRLIGTQRGRIDDAELAQVAARYIAAIDREERAPAAAVAIELRIGRARVRDLLRRARAIERGSTRPGWRHPHGEGRRTP